MTIFGHIARTVNNIKIVTAIDTKANTTTYTISFCVVLMRSPMMYNVTKTFIFEFEYIYIFIQGTLPLQTSKCLLTLSICRKNIFLFFRWATSK